MKALLIFILSVLSTAVFGVTVQETCYTDIDKCTIAIFSENGMITSIYSTSAPTPEGKKELNDLGINVLQVSATDYAALKSRWNVETRYSSISADANDIDSIPDEEWEAYYSGLKCVGAIGSCAISTYTGVQSGGLLLYWSKVNCGLAGATCAHAIRNYQKWKKYQEKKKEEVEKIVNEDSQVPDGRAEPGANPPAPRPTPIGPPGGTGGRRPGELGLKQPEVKIIE